MTELRKIVPDEFGFPTFVPCWKQSDIPAVKVLIYCPNTHCVPVTLQVVTQDGVLNFVCPRAACGFRDQVKLLDWHE